MKTVSGERKGRRPAVHYVRVVIARTKSGPGREKQGCPIDVSQLISQRKKRQEGTIDRLHIFGEAN